jgi:predicted dehydrogenase
MKLGLIGLKGHQGVVLSGMKQLGGWEVVGVAETDAKEVERFKRREPQAKNAIHFEDWRRLLDHSQMDVCLVCDENAARAEQLIALAKLGVHVVTEKPLTTTLPDLKRVRDAWAKAKGRLTMLLTMRHEPKYPTARKLVREGAIGEPVQASAQKSYRLEARQDWFKKRAILGGTIPYIGIHALDLIRWVGGQDFTHVAAFHGTQGKRDVMGETESHASVLLRLANGGSATARLDYLRPSTTDSHGDDRLRIAGTEGVIEMRQDNAKVMLVTGKKKPYEVEAAKVPNLFVGFWLAVQNGEPSPIPAEDCFYLTEVVLKARDAADAGKVIEIV